MHREPKLLEQDQDKDHEGSSESDYTLTRLLHRIWYIMTHAWNKERISRGEYILSFTVIQLVWMVAATLLLVGMTIGWWEDQFLRWHGDLIVSLPIVCRSIGLVVRRVYDLWRWALTSVYIPYALWWIGYIPSLFFSDPTMDNYTLIQFVWWVCLTVGSVRAIIVSLFCFFKKWIAWENRYGADPLLHQPKNNRLYRQFYALCVLFAFLWGIFMWGMRGMMG